MALHRWTRRLLVGLGLVLGPVIVAVALLQTSPVATWVARQLIRFVPLNPGYTLEVGRVSGNWISRLQLEDVRIRREGRELARVDRLWVRYDPRRLQGAETRLDSLAIDGIRATTRRTRDGWDLANVLRRSADTTTGGRPLAVDQLTLRDGRVAAEFGPDSTLQVRDLSVRAHDLVLGKVAVVTIDTVAAKIAPPTRPPPRRPHWLTVAARGAATATELRFDPLRFTTDRSIVAGAVVLPRRWDNAGMVDRLAVRLDAAPLALADVAAWMPSVRPEGALQLALRASAKDRVASGHLTGRLGDASLALDGSAAVGSNAPVAVRIRGTVRALDPARLTVAAPVGRLNGDFEADLQGRNLRQTNGHVDFRVTRSRIATVALEQIGFRANFAEGRAEVVTRGAVGQGTIAARGWARPFDSIPSYRLAGEVQHLPGSDSLVRHLVGPEGDPILAVRFTVVGNGTALTTARLTGRADVVAVRRSGERNPLGHAPLTLANGRLELRPELLVGGGRITGLVTAQFGDTVTYEVSRGTIDRVDLGRLSGDTVVAPLSGRFALSGRGIAPAAAVVNARFELNQLRYGRRRLERVTATARLDRGRASIVATGAVQGGLLALDLDARPFDSTRTFVVRRASLDRVDVGTLLGQPALAGPVTLRFSGNGRMMGSTRVVRGRVDVQPSRLGKIDVQTGTLTATLDDDQATYDATVRTNGGTVALAGDADALRTAPAFAIRRGSFDSLDLAAVLGRPSLKSRLNGRLTGAVQGRGIDSLHANLALELLPSSVGDSSTIQSGRLAFDLDRGAIRGDVHLQSSDGQFLAQAALQTASDTSGVVSVGGTVTATGALRNVRLDTLLVALRPAPGVVDVDTVLLRSNVVVLDGAGRLALRPSAGSDTLRLVGHARNLTPIMALAGLDTVSVDSARIGLTVTGPARHWQVAGEADARHLLYAGKQAERLALRANVSVDSTGVAGLAGELKVEGGAVGPVQINEFAATARYDSMVALQATATLRDSVRLVTALRGTVVGDTVRTTLERLDLVEGGRTWTLERPTDLVLRPWIGIDSFALRAGDHRIRASGRLAPHGSSDLSVRVDSFDLDVLRELGLAPVPGRLDGNLRLTGPAATPTLDGRFSLTVRRGAENLGQITTTLLWTAAGLRVEAVAAPRRGGRLTAKGTLPWPLTLAPTDTGASANMVRKVADTLGFTVGADSFDLAFFDPLLPRENANNLRGLLALQARIAGTLKEPWVEGNLRMSGVGVALPPLGLEYQQGELVGDFTGDALRVTRLQLRTDGKEELAAQGLVRFRPLTDPALDLTATLQDFRVSNSPTLHTIASGKLQLRGTATTPSLTGNLRLGRTEIFQGAEGKTAAVKAVELSPADMQELAQHFGTAVLAHANKGLGLVERFRLDIDVRLPGNVWFRRRVNPRADIELSGRIKMKQEPGRDMQFFGRVEPTPGRGLLDVYGRNFRLTGGEIRLAGPVDSMTLDVTAQYQVPTQSGPDAGLLIDVAAKGRVDSLSLAFTSEPSLGQEDIISYIVTGRPASENPLAAQGGSPGQAGAELAFGALSEKVAGAAGEKLGLDVFQIKQDGLRGLTLTAGRYIAPRVFLSLQQPIQLSSDAQQAPGSSLGLGFELEYSARRWLRANLRGGSLPPRFFLRGRHAY